MAQYLQFQIARKLIEKKLERFKIQHLPFYDLCSRHLLFFTDTNLGN